MSKILRLIHFPSMAGAHFFHDEATTRMQHDG
jgi:hypothetical protein